MLGKDSNLKPNSDEIEMQDIYQDDEERFQAKRRTQSVQIPEFSDKQTQSFEDQDSNFEKNYYSKYSTETSLSKSDKVPQLLEECVSTNVLLFTPLAQNYQFQDEKTQTICRILFSVIFLLGAIYGMFNVERVDTITTEKCMRDLTFELTEPINQFLRENVAFRNCYIAYSSFLMDLMILTFMLMFYKYWKSYRIVIAYVLFFGCRTFLQKNFFMGRLEGFAYFNPGIYSLTVPYHDVNDFFYSGHVGTCFLILMEYRSAKFFKLSYFTLFILINQWTMLSFVRTHYIIDLITGVIFAHYSFIQAERISYVTDVIVLGIGKGKNRYRKYFYPCKVCAWPCQTASDFMHRKEKLILKKLYEKQNRLSFSISHSQDEKSLSKSDAKIDSQIYMKQEDDC